MQNPVLCLAGVSVHTHSSLQEIGRRAWDALAGPEPPPYLRWEWLDALEKTRRVCPERGWTPCHITIRDRGQLLAAAPAYLKEHSDGEFVFDHAWARLAERKLALQYYPKLVVAIPFTPANGPRFLIRGDQVRDRIVGLLAKALPPLAERLGASGVHVLFPDAGTAAELGAAGFVERHGIQHHFDNPGYANFEEFLSRFSAKRRAQIRRERRDLAATGVHLTIATGGDISEEMIESIYTFYRLTVDRHPWGRRYLDRAFFYEVCTSMPDAIHLVLARDGPRGALLGGAFNLLGSRVLYGRYWGARAERPFLHFNVCYYAAIEDAIARGLERFEPGAGGEHKHPRGFDPKITRSAHWLASPALFEAASAFCALEREVISRYWAECAPVLLRGPPRREL